MSADVFQFQRPEATTPHVSGEARCCDCRHEWAAVVEAEAHDSMGGWLECPACSLVRGRFKYAFQLAEGESFWRCNCGCDLFQVTPEGIHCPNCGTHQEFP